MSCHGERGDGAGESDDPDARARFEREAKAVAALSHPNILAIHDIGVERDASGHNADVVYAVTELLEPQSRCPVCWKDN